MSVLLDTQRLSARVQDLVTDPRRTVAISAATVWEVEIKRRLGKLRLPDGFATECLDRGFDELPIAFTHAEVAGRLPRHHDDPFDRILIAQAMVEGYDIVTADDRFHRYDVRVIDPS